MANPFDNDLAGDDEPEEVRAGSLTQELASLIEPASAEAGETLILNQGEIPRMPRNARELAQMAGTLEEAVAALATEMNRKFVQDQLPRILPDLVRAISEKESAHRQAFYAAVLEEVVAKNDLNLAQDRDPMLIQIITSDNCRFSGELVKYDERGAMCILEAKDDRSMSAFTYGIPLRDIQCIALSIEEAMALDAWKFISVKLESRFKSYQREESVHNRYKAFLEIMGFDAHEQRILNARLKEGEEPQQKRQTPIQFQLKGGSVVVGEFVAIDRSGCLMRDESFDLWFFPYESIVIHGVLSERYDELEAARAKARNKPVPERIERKRRESLRNQLAMGHDEDFRR